MALGSARFGVTYDSRTGLIALLHRLGFEHRRPKPIARKLNPQKQRDFIAGYEALLHRLADDEMVMFADAVHPTYGAQPVGCWAPRHMALAVAQTTAREHVNIHGALDLESGITCILLEQNDEWAVQRGRYMILETMAGLNDDPIVKLTAVAA